MLFLAFRFFWMVVFFRGKVDILEPMIHGYLKRKRFCFGWVSLAPIFINFEVNSGLKQIEIIFDGFSGVKTFHNFFPGSYKTPDLFYTIICARAVRVFDKVGQMLQIRF